MKKLKRKIEKQLMEWKKIHPKAPYHKGVQAVRQNAFRFRVLPQELQKRGLSQFFQESRIRPDFRRPA